MKIKTLFNKDEHDDITLDNYLSRCGIEDVELFKNPTRECLDDPSDYENMEKVYRAICEVINGKEI